MQAEPPRASGEQERGNFRGACFKCGEPGHMKRDCTNKTKAKAPAPAKTKEKDEPKRDMRCATCEVENEHFTRQCPLQTCLGCGEKGHAKLDCPSKEKKKDENKTSPSKYPSKHPVAAAAVLKIAAKIDGKSAVVGLDTYAGCGMVLDSCKCARASPST